MKLHSLVIALVVTTLVPAFALTPADITPAALVGKTLTFTCEYSTAPFVNSGTWTGTFETSPANGFTIVGMTGLPADVTTTRTYASDGTFEAYRLGSIYSGSGNATLSIYTNTDGTAGYEVNLIDLDKTASYQAGSFTIGGSVVKTSEIDVKQGKTVLKDGKGKVDFSTVLITKKGKSRAKAITITNSGDAPLTNLRFSVNGKNRKEFVVSAPKIGVIAPGASVTIRVTFTPKAIGNRKAALHILSSDKDEASFDVALSGAGGGKK